MSDKTKKTNSQFDITDVKIIELLAKNSKLPYQDIGNELGISSSTVHLRVKKLELLGIIKNYSIKIDYYKMGLYLTAFIGITIDGKKHDKVQSKLMEVNGIVDLHNTTGKYHLMAKIICRDPLQLSEILVNNISVIDGVDKTETIISLGQIEGVKNDTFGKDWIKSI